MLVVVEHRTNQPTNQPRKKIETHGTLTMRVRCGPLLRL